MREIDRSLAIAAAVAGVTFWIAFDNGSYELPARATLAIVVWWAVLLGLALQLLAPRRLPWATLLAGGVLAALAGWTLLSVAWAPSAEDGFAEFNRVSLYLGLYVLVALAASRRTVGRWLDGLAVAISGVVVVGLVSRLFPGSFPDRGLEVHLPSAVTRLSFPVGYWNGLAILAALGVPLLLRVALGAHRPAVRGLALAPLPAIACVLYLASSRGGVLTAVIGSAAFVLLAERRWSAVAALGVTAVASAVALGVLAVRDELVNGPLGTEAVRDQGRSGAALLVLVCAAAAVTYGLGCRYLAGRLQPSARIGRVAGIAAAVLLLVAVVAADPVSRFDTFKTPPPELEQIERGDFVASHLLSGSGSGRWQFWSAALDQSSENPVLGDGAGTFEHWWAEHASFSYFLRDAHSLYLETLGELGPVGFALVLALLLGGAVVGARRALHETGEARVTAAALTAVLVAYAVSAGFDWMWELTAVSAVGVAALALVTGPATDPAPPLRAATPGESVTRLNRRRFGLGVLAVLTAWLLVVAQAIPLIADREIARSQRAVAGGDLDEAREAAEDARDIQPWASSPLLQLALVHERLGRLGDARVSIGEAIERDPRDWQLWLVSARVETKLGNVRGAERSLARAVSLNPRSPLFAGLLPNS